jgi:uncharacterized membrane protein
LTLFKIVEKVTPDKAIAPLSKYGGTVIRSDCSRRQSRRYKRLCTANPET